MSEKTGCQWGFCGLTEPGQHWHEECPGRNFDWLGVPGRKPDERLVQRGILTDDDMAQIRDHLARSKERAQ